jgi:hypothetical protein
VGTLPELAAVLIIFDVDLQGARKSVSPRMFTRKQFVSTSYVPNAPQVSPIFTGGVVHGRAPSQRDMESPRTMESRFTIPDIPSNAEFYASRAQSQAQLYSGKY